MLFIEIRKSEEYMMKNNKIAKYGLIAAGLIFCVICIFLNVHYTQKKQTFESEEITGIMELEDMELLPELLQDSDIDTIIIPEGEHFSKNMLVVDKDIIVEEHAQLEVGYLKIEDGASLQVKGNLNLRNAVLADEETKKRIVVEAGGTILENEMHMCISDIRMNAVSIHNWEELKSAMENKTPVCIESDITIEEDLVVETPFYVGVGINMSVADNAKLKIYGGVLLNAGTLNAQISAVDGTIYNIGEMNSRKIELSDSCLINAGTLSLQLENEDEFVLICETDSNVFNSGNIVTEEGTGIQNKGRIENSGNIVIESGCRFENNVFCNRGIFESQFSSTIDENSGIYYGYGEFRINGISNVAVWRTADDSLLYGWKEVSTEEEFAEAMEDNEIDKIIVCDDLTISEETEISKPMLVNACVSVEEGTYVAIENTYMILLEHGDFAASNLELSNALVVDSLGKTKEIYREWALDEDSAIVVEKTLLQYQEEYQ